MRSSVNDEPATIGLALEMSDNNAKLIQTRSLLVIPGRDGCFIFDVATIVSKPKRFLDVLTTVMAYESNRAVPLGSILMCPRPLQPTTIKFGEGLVVQLHRDERMVDMAGYYQGISNEGVQIQMVVEKRKAGDDALQCRMSFGAEENNTVDIGPIVMAKKTSSSGKRQCYEIQVDEAGAVFHLAEMGIVTNVLSLCFLRTPQALLKTDNGDHYADIVLQKRQREEGYKDRYQLYQASIPREFLRHLTSLEVYINVKFDESEIIVKVTKSNGFWCETHDMKVYRRGKSLVGYRLSKGSALWHVVEELNEGRKMPYRPVVVFTKPSMRIRLGNVQFPLWKSVSNNPSPVSVQSSKPSSPGEHPSSCKIPKLCKRPVQKTATARDSESPVRKKASVEGPSRHDKQRKVSPATSASMFTKLKRRFGNASRGSEAQTRTRAGEPSAEALAAASVTPGVYVNEGMGLDRAVNDSISVEVSHHGQQLAVELKFEDSEFAASSQADRKNEIKKARHRWANRKTALIPLRRASCTSSPNCFYLEIFTLSREDRLHALSTLARIASARGIAPTSADGQGYSFFNVRLYEDETRRNGAADRNLRLDFDYHNLTSQGHKSVVLRLRSEKGQSCPRLPHDRSDSCPVFYCTPTASHGFGAITLRVYDNNPWIVSFAFVFPSSLPTVCPYRVPLNGSIYDGSKELSLDLDALTGEQRGRLSMQFFEAGLHAYSVEPMLPEETKLRFETNDEWTLRFSEGYVFQLRRCHRHY
ncbi:hypothetical protein FOZ61_002265 [Perkinsus olseni]|uniref:Uncharacterized protein n=1 Tax=Perkinsus olseni TaxID=32597 RepID=A0A7J6LU75_PEROL|nr:hypothetical protein FOZ61_002265 [Perkinsus olseni]KAF4668379.1 hypothetical protein FOL46_002024 [Perkinsus olseni]